MSAAVLHEVKLVREMRRWSGRWALLKNRLPSRVPPRLAPGGRRVCSPGWLCGKEEAVLRSKAASIEVTGLVRETY